MTEAQSLRLYREAFRSWFERKLEDLPEGTRRILRRKTRNSPTETLISAGWELSKWRDFSAKWRRPAFDRKAAIDALVEKIHELARLTSDPSDPSQQPVPGHGPGADPERKHPYRRTELGRETTMASRRSLFKLQATDSTNDFGIRGKGKPSTASRLSVTTFWLCTANCLQPSTRLSATPTRILPPCCSPSSGRRLPNTSC